MSSKYFDFQKKFPGLRLHKEMASLTTFQIGGPADLYYELTDNAELPFLIQEALEKKIPFVILGGGSNIIFSEEGFRGLIVHLKTKKIEVQDDRIVADAGALLSLVVQASLKSNLSGMEKMMGLPGTIGGAVRGNAGAFGVETKDLVIKAEIYNREKGCHTVEWEYFKFGYRESVIKHNQDILLKIYLKLTKQEGKESLQEALAILKSRAGTQPTGRCSGSFFKNPDPIKTAGYLLDHAGCKNLQIGQAKVSEKHANWIMNLGEATQNDVMTLSTLMQEKVKTKFNILLEREVQFVGVNGFLKF